MNRFQFAPKWGLICGLVTVLVLSGFTWAAMAQVFLFIKSTTAPTSIIPSLQVSRTSCNLPCYIFADATGTSDSDTSKPIHELDYCFSAGDGVGGAYTDHGHGKTPSRGTFCGAPNWGYVYTTPGSHSLSLNVTAVDGDTASTLTVITVSDYTDDQTTCVFDGPFNADSDARCTGANVRKIDGSGTAFQTLIEDAISAGDLRILFHEDGSFQQTSLVFLGTDGLHIGVYGTGGDGRFTVTSSSPQQLFAISNNDDIRITDLQTDMNATSATHRFIEINMTSPYTDHLLVQNNIVTDPGYFFQANFDLGGGTRWPQYHGVFDNVVTECGESNLQCWYTSVIFTALVNNDISGVPGSNDGHILRFNAGSEAFIHNNKVSGAGDTQDHTLTIRACGSTCLVTNNRVAENFFISDNYFINRTAQGLHFGSNTGAIHPNGSHDNLIFDRNFVTFVDRGQCDPTQDCQRHLQLTTGGSGTTTNYTVRNNIFHLDGVYQFGDATGGEITSGMVLESNSWYSATGGNDINFRQSSTTGATGNCEAYNNLIWSNDGVTLSFRRSGANISQPCTASVSNWDSDGGETGVSALGSTPYAVNPPSKTNASNFELRTAAPCSSLVSTGEPRPNRRDYYGNVRNQAQPTVGAMETGVTCS